MEDCKLEQLHIDESYRNVESSVRSDSLRQVASTFVRNIDPAVSLLKMPSAIALSVQQNPANEALAQILMQAKVRSA